MSTAVKWIIGVIVVALAAAGLWMSGLLSTSPLPGQQTSTTPQADSGLPTSQADNSDQAVAQDSAAIDTELQGLSQDQTNVDSSLNDQPGQQSY